MINQDNYDKVMSKLTGSKMSNVTDVLNDIDNNVAYYNPSRY